MLATLAALLAIGVPLEFPLEPIQTELARGEKVYYAGKGVDRIMMEDRQIIGRWFDGQLRRDMDDVTWLSPNLLSRWLGYLNAKEKWSETELAQRWETLKESFNGTLSFVVQTYALPKQGFFDLTDGAESKPRTALQVRFAVSWLSEAGSGDNRHQETAVGQKKKEAPLLLQDPFVSNLGIFRGYDLGSIDRWPWYALDQRFDPLAPEFGTRRPTEYDGVVGDYVRAVYLVQAPVPEEGIPAKNLELRVFAEGKEPIARFDLTARGK